MPSIPHYVAFNQNYSIKDVLKGTTQLHNDSVSVLASSNNEPTESFNLSLSAEAQSILQVLMGSSEDTEAESKTGFLLTLPQQQEIDAIIERHKDEAFTEETFNKIQQDLWNVGLSPQQLALEQHMEAYNPVQILIDEMDGKDGSEYCRESVDGITETAEAQKNMDTYMLYVFQEWQNISTTAPKSGDYNKG